MRAMGVLAAIVLSVGLVGGAVAAPLEPLVLGWERFFTVNSETWNRRDRPWVGGYVYNSSGHIVVRMQLLVEGVDGAGQVTSQQVDWLGSTIPPFGRAYFEVPTRVSAPQYRVRVFAYDVIQSARMEAP
jgi:hypothetical protein